MKLMYLLTAAARGEEITTPDGALPPLPEQAARLFTMLADDYEANMVAVPVGAIDNGPGDLPIHLESLTDTHLVVTTDYQRYRVDRDPAAAGDAVWLLCEVTGCSEAPINQWRHVLRVCEDHLDAETAFTRGMLAGKSADEIREIRMAAWLESLTIRVQAGEAAKVERAALIRQLHRADPARWTQTRLAESAGISQPAVSKLIKMADSADATN